MNEGIRLWNKAIRVIPGGNGLLSKRPSRYVPDIWPTYYSKCKGVEVWDLEGKKYIDMAQMAIGSCVLGYCDDDVDSAVLDSIKRGINNTLNNPNEVALAQKLLKINEFAGGVKFARSGAEAMSIAIRIARAYSGKDQIAFSGYHGWSDWYLAANIDDENNLSKHLLPGLEAKGVPNALLNSIFPFEYNNLQEIEQIVEANDIGVIVIEGARYDLPEDDFIEGICRIAKERQIVLVVDEITSGWRISNGGVYKIKGYIPDIVVYGKALGNGYAISAIVGKKEVMDVSQDTFVSSTFWTEGVGFAAALATIEKFEKYKVGAHLINIGGIIADGWKKLAFSHNIKLKTTKFKPLITFKFDYGNLNPLLDTLFIQEMLKRGYLASNSVYVSLAHTKEIVKDYMESVNEVFALISKAIKDKNVQSLLQTRIREDGFKRLN